MLTFLLHEYEVCSLCFLPKGIFDVFFCLVFIVRGCFEFYITLLYKKYN